MPEPIVFICLGVSNFALIFLIVCQRGRYKAANGEGLPISLNVKTRSVEANPVLNYSIKWSKKIKNIKQFFINSRTDKS